MARKFFLRGAITATQIFASSQAVTISQLPVEIIAGSNPGCLLAYRKASVTMIYQSETSATKKKFASKMVMDKMNLLMMSRMSTMTKMRKTTATQKTKMRKKRKTTATLKRKMRKKRRTTATLKTKMRKNGRTTATNTSKMSSGTLAMMANGSSYIGLTRTETAGMAPNSKSMTS